MAVGGAGVVSWLFFIAFSITSSSKDVIDQEIVWGPTAESIGAVIATVPLLVVFVLIWRWPHGDN